MGTLKLAWGPYVCGVHDACVHWAHALKQPWLHHQAQCFLFVCVLFVCCCCWVFCLFVVVLLLFFVCFFLFVCLGLFVFFGGGGGGGGDFFFLIWNCCYYFIFRLSHIKNETFSLIIFSGAIAQRYKQPSDFGLRTISVSELLDFNHQYKH